MGFALDSHWIRTAQGSPQRLRESAVHGGTRDAYEHTHHLGHLNVYLPHRQEVGRVHLSSGRLCADDDDDDDDGGDDDDDDDAGDDDEDEDDDDDGDNDDDDGNDEDDGDDDEDDDDDDDNDDDDDDGDYEHHISTTPSPSRRSAAEMTFSFALV